MDLLGGGVYADEKLDVDRYNLAMDNLRAMLLDLFKNPDGPMLTFPTFLGRC